jgi:hypothetical protein
MKVSTHKLFLSLLFALEEVTGHTIRKVHSDIYQLVPSSALVMDTYQPSLLVLSILSLHSSSQYYLISPSTRQRRKIKETYTQTPSLPSLFLTFNWKIPLVYPFSPTIWPTHALARVDR